MPHGGLLEKPREEIVPTSRMAETMGVYTPYKVRKVFLDANAKRKKAGKSLRGRAGDGVPENDSTKSVVKCSFV